MIFSAILALQLQSALQIFDILLTFGAGTGLIFILRWFWWRINAWSEISAMFASGILSILLKTTSLGLFFAAESDFSFLVQYLCCIGTSAIWITVTYMTPAEDKSVLKLFIKKSNRWPRLEKVIDEAEKENINITDDSQGGVFLRNYRHVAGLWNDLRCHVCNWVLDLWEYIRASIITVLSAVLQFIGTNLEKGQGQGDVNLAQKCTSNVATSERLSNRQPSLSPPVHSGFFFVPEPEYLSPRSEYRSKQNWQNHKHIGCHNHRLLVAKMQSIFQLF